jgi:molybdopterin-guanine dinucleotide biosynthesis protein
MSIYSKNISIVILAGGQGRRMQNQDKGLLQWQNKLLIEHVLDHLSNKSDDIIINANRNIEIYNKYGYKVINDSIDGYQGPLVGIFSAMQQSTHDFLLCVPCDSPAPPENLAERLMQCMLDKKTKSAICHDGNRTQPLFSLLSCSLKNQLGEFLNQGNRKVHDFFNQTNTAICDFSDQSNRFHNFNTPDDMS